VQSTQKENIMAEMTNVDQAKEHYLRGDAYVGEKDLDSAIVEFKAALLLDPTLNDARDYLARCVNDIALRYANNKDIANSIAEYSKAITFAKGVDFPKDLLSVMYFNRGVGYREAGDYKQAARDFWEAGRLNPDDPDCRQNELAATARSGSKPYRSSIPSGVDDYIKRGREYLQKGDYDKAIADFNDAIILDPKSAIAYRELGEAYKSKGDYDKVIANYTQAISINPESPFHYSARGDAYKSKGDYDKAIADFTKAISINPKSFFYSARSEAYKSKGDNEKAAADVKEMEQLRAKEKRADGIKGTIGAIIGALIGGVLGIIIGTIVVGIAGGGTGPTIAAILITLAGAGIGGKSGFSKGRGY
jgi:tetratricopeptide (TPR) repeat protein